MAIEALRDHGRTLAESIRGRSSLRRSLLLCGILSSLLYVARFRLYSIATLVIMVVFGILIGMDAPRVAANLPTRWVGVCERINIGAFLLWVVVLAFVLLRGRGAQGEPGVR